MSGMSLDGPAGIFQKVSHRPEGFSPVRYGIFLLFGDFSQCDCRIIVRYEDRIIAETAFSCPGSGYAALKRF